MKWQARYSKPIILPSSWQQLQQGELYRQAISHYLSDWFQQILGYQILKIGGLSGEIPCDLPLRHQIVIGNPISPENLATNLSLNCSLLQANPEQLPLIQQSMDACFLIHTLNFSQDPHQILREVDRVLVKDGFLFLSLYNPLSKLFFKNHLQCKGGTTPLFFRKYAIWRVIDWLELLNFDILARQNLKLDKIQLPFPYTKNLCSPITMIVARKRTIPLTLMPQKVQFSSQPFFSQPLNALSKKHMDN